MSLVSPPTPSQIEDFGIEWIRWLDILRTQVMELQHNPKIRTLNISDIPTSSTGLVSGDVWSNAGVLTIV